MKYIITLLSSFVVGLYAKAGYSNAAGGDPYGVFTTGSAAGLSTSTDLSAAVANTINAALGITGIIFLILAVYGGFVIMLSQGKEDSYKKGKDTILWATIGLIVIFAAYALTNFVFTSILKP